MRGHTSSNQTHEACSGKLEDGTRRSQQKIEDLNVIIASRLKSVTQVSLHASSCHGDWIVIFLTVFTCIQALESQLEEKTKEYDELQQQYKMLELNLQQVRHLCTLPVV